MDGSEAVVSLSGRRNTLHMQRSPLLRNKMIPPMYVNFYCPVSIKSSPLSSAAHYVFDRLRILCLDSSWEIMKWLTSSSAQYDRCDATAAISDMSKAPLCSS